MRKFLTGLNFGHLRIVPLLWIGVFGTPLVDQANAQTSPAVFKPTRLEAFLAQYPVSKGEAKHIAKKRDAQGWANSHSIIRIFKHKRAAFIAYDAGKYFEEDCKIRDGKSELLSSPYASTSNTSRRICVLSDGTASGALIAYHYSDRYNDKYVEIFLLSASGAADLKTAYQRDTEKEQNYQKQLQRQREAELANRQARLADWAQWRTKLVVGSDTNCGPIIALRGPMVEVASYNQSAWHKRDHLFPPGARDSAQIPIRCGLTDPT
jgi:hypothetical protein